MKLLRLTSIALFLVSMLAGISCKNNDDGGANPGDSCKISYKVDGKNASETLLICAYLDETLNIGLIGSNSIQLQIANLTTTGDYDFTNSDVVVLIRLSDGTNLVQSDNGAVTVSTINNSSAKGTFAGTFYASDDLDQTIPFLVTAGSFDASY